MVWAVDYCLARDRESDHPATGYSSVCLRWENRHALLSGQFEQSRQSGQSEQFEQSEQSETWEQFEHSSPCVNSDVSDLVK